MKQNALTDKAHWGNVAQNYVLPATIKTRRYYCYHRLVQLFRILPRHPVTLLEIGCAPGGWLAYFAKRCGYIVSGIEYTESGVQATKKNLVLQGVSADIRHEDLFASSFRKTMFDIVFSFGLIEHFQNPRPCIQKHEQFLKPGGWLVLIVPNMRSPLYGALQKIFAPEVAHMHRPYTPKSLQKFCTGTTIVHCGYVGVCNFNLINPNRLPSMLSHIYWGISIALNWVMVAMLIGRETSFFSPYIVYIGRK